MELVGATGWVSQGGAKVTVIGAVSIKQVLAVMTLSGSMDGNALRNFYQKMRAFHNYGSRAVVVMDNVPAHKIAAIEPLIKAVGDLSYKQADLNPRRVNE